MALVSELKRSTEDWSYVLGIVLTPSLVLSHLSLAQPNKPDGTVSPVSQVRTLRRGAEGRGRGQVWERTECPEPWTQDHTAPGEA